MNLPVKIFSSRKESLIDQPFLAEAQIVSWRWFIEKGLKNLFEEISPIRDYSGKDLELYFLDYYFDEPKYPEEVARMRDFTYEAPLRAKVKLVNHRSNETKEQEVYLGDFPVMTATGTFIINGIERTVVSQLIRSPGVYFTAEYLRGKKLFGAKVIPNRGCWLEFATEPDGAIGVKIDRHRRAPVTQLLRVFGLTERESIYDAVVNTDAAKTYIDATFKKDPSKSASDSYSEIYKRLRPGDLATPENAKSLIDAMFWRKDRYSLSTVGRYKINQRLGIDKKNDSQILDLQDVTLVVREIIRLNSAESRSAPDDIDHLGNRRVRTVGELLENRLYVGFARLRRNIQDRMSTLDMKTVTPVQLINARPLVAVVREFFSSSQLSQFMDQVNILSELEHKRRLSSMGPGGLTRERAGFEVRDVHSSHYGRICPIQTPEGQNIGLINHLSSYARLNQMGFLETPYLRVRNGLISDEVLWLDAIEEEKYTIAQGNTKIDLHRRIVEDVVEARVHSEPVTVKRNAVDLIDAAPNQLISIGTSLIPFLEHDDANRALMGSNMQRQAVPSIQPHAPLVGTGVEEKAARDSGRLILAEEDGVVVDVDARRIVVEGGRTKKPKTYNLHTFRRSNHYTAISERPIVLTGDHVKKGAVLADAASSDGGVLALGQNLLVAFLSWEGANFEDAIVLSERVVKDDLFTSVHVEDFYCDVRDTKLGPEIITPDIPNVSEEKLKNLDEEGIIRIGAEVVAGDILVGKISPKGEVEPTSEEKLLRAVFGEKVADVKDTSLVLPHGKAGRVVAIKIFSRDRGDKLEPGIIKRIQIEIAELRKVRAGDKLAGRHGNKGVISQVRPVEDMPYLEDGTPIDIVLNPLGVASRMNLGQILETHLGIAAHQQGFRAVTPVFVGATEDEIKKELVAAGLPENGKLTLFDGRSGLPFGQKVTVGYIYMMKLNHLVEDKIHMRSIGPYSLITQQPLGGKAQFGGQRFGEMEVWALEGYGAAYTLQEMLTIKSDDVLGRSASFEAIIRGEKIKSPSMPSAFNVLVSELKALGLSILPIDREEDVRLRSVRTFHRESSRTRE
ncbi:DNA-directed RNA polymerase subunit beta [Candidatus Wolfebacteria bacterium]|nr:DNA-directed RNA polymerase subunit beta [Candidatus Wolfebacteria bacterium]